MTRLGARRTTLLLLAAVLLAAGPQLSGASAGSPAVIDPAPQALPWLHVDHGGA
ncbi:MAG: hypothetical protein QOG03_232, partial [Actinomycetota bacterium]|nr:hypothetical protein [Actinomycetota bacterium]